MTKHEELLEAYLRFLSEQTTTQEPKNLYEPITYLMGLGGKRLRPVLCLLAYDMLRTPGADALWLAQSVEVFHNFTLMHDDIMDDAPLRRGKQTVHEKWNTPTAILSGDLMLIQAYSSLHKAIAGRMGIWGEFNTMAEEVCKGQQLDMDFEHRSDVSLDEYLQMIDWKTAVLLAFSLKSGAMLAGAHESICDHLYAFGMKIGRGFQLMDDYLDTFGDPEKVGKQAGGDIIEGKKTYLLLHTLQQAGPDRERIESLLKLEDEEMKVALVKDAFITYKADEAIQLAIKECFEDGYELLNRIPRDTGELERYVHWLEGRTH